MYCCYHNTTTQVDAKDAELRSFYDNCTFTRDKIDKLNQLVQILTSFEIVTKEIGIEKYVTSSKVLLFIKILYLKLNNFQQNPEMVHMISVLDKMKSKFDNHFIQLFENNRLMCHRTFLYPHFKKVEFCEESRYQKKCSDLQHQVSSIARANQQEEDKRPPPPTKSANEDVGRI